MRKSLKAIAVTGAAVLGIATVGIGWAYFSESVNADAAGAAGTTSQMTSVVGTLDTQFAGDKLYPGYSGNVQLSVTNPNEVPMLITGVTPASGTNIVTSASGCEAHVELAPTPGVEVWVDGVQIGSGQIPAAKTATLVLPGAVTLKSSAGNGCKSSSITTKWKVDAENR